MEKRNENLSSFILCVPNATSSSRNYSKYQASVQGAIIECTTQHWSPKFHNTDENFEDRQLSANYNNQLNAVVIADP